MNVSFLAMRLQTEVMRHREELEATYDRNPDSMKFWGSIDLVSSSNYRLGRGPKRGYVRGETFFSIVRSVVEPASEINLLKEMGDAVLLSSADFRPLLEAVILIDRIARQLSHTIGESEFPFAVRYAIDFGPAKRMMRRHEDFLGVPIDRLSRLMQVRHPTSNFVINSEMVGFCGDILKEYQEFLQIEEEQMLSAALSKGLRSTVYFRPISLDQDKLAEFREFFLPWKTPVASVQRRSEDG